MALRIKELRAERKWTQDELASRAGMSRSQLAMIEAETRPANTLRLNAIAAAFGVPPEALFDSGSEDLALLQILKRLDADDRAAVVQIAEALAAKRGQD
jgi:transcriptional regulator with XRE-family HTH domain